MSESRINELTRGMQTARKQSGSESMCDENIKYEQRDHKVKHDHLKSGAKRKNRSDH